MFAVETQERKYILCASDPTTKGIWLAKLSEHCGQGTYHFHRGLLQGEKRAFSRVPQAPPTQSEGHASLSHEVARDECSCCIFQGIRTNCVTNTTLDRLMGGAILTNVSVSSMSLMCAGFACASVLIESGGWLGGN